MNDASIIDFSGRNTVTDPLTDLLRELLQAAVEAERDAFLAEFTERRTRMGARRLLAVATTRSVLCKSGLGRLRSRCRRMANR